MSELEQLELQVLQVVGQLNLRATLDRAAAAGELLGRAKAVVPHGAWLGWLKRVGLSRQSASDYMIVAREIGSVNVRQAGHLSIRQLLETIRQVKYRDRQAQRQALREQAARVRGGLPDRLRLVRADCRRYKWPSGIGIVAADPPWRDLDAYRWLAGMAAGRLRDGGLVMAMAGVSALADVMGVFTSAGLTYRHTLALIYGNVQRSRPVSSFIPAWRPIILFAKGERVIRGPFSDGYTIRFVSKDYHDWEQVVDPWRFWLDRLADRGLDELVVDPYSGSGTSGVACHQLGLRWLGTEKDVAAYRVARGRLAGLVRGSGETTVGTH